MLQLCHHRINLFGRAALTVNFNIRAWAIIGS